MPDMRLSARVQTKGIEKLFNSNRGHEATSVQLNPITFPCIKTLEAIILCPDRPENVARQISAIHCIGKDISHLVGSLIILTWDGKCIQALGSTLNHLHFQQLFAYPGLFACCFSILAFLHVFVIS